jgi:hypothetical protein
MDHNILKFRGLTLNKTPPDQVLEQTIGKLDTVVILGYDKDGEHYFASSDSDGGTVIWLMEKLKLQLLNVTAEDI